MKKSRRNILIAVGVCLGIVALCVFFFWLLPKIFNEWISEKEIEQFLSGKTGVRGMLYLALFQVLQVLSIFFPGTVVQVAGGLVFGITKAFFVCLVAFVGANIAVFFLARLRRNTRAQSGSGGEKQSNRRIQKVLDWINSSDPFFMVMLAYMMPGIPNGFVPYAAVHTNITLRQFSLSVTLGSIIQIFINCVIGGRIMAGDYVLSFIMTVGSFVLIFLIYKVKDRIIAFGQRCQKSTKEQGING